MPLARRKTRTALMLLSGAAALSGCAAHREDVGREIASAIQGPAIAAKPDTAMIESTPPSAPPAVSRAVAPSQAQPAAPAPQAQLAPAATSAPAPQPAPAPAPAAPAETQAPAAQQAQTAPKDWTTQVATAPQGAPAPQPAPQEPVAAASSAAPRPAPDASLPNAVAASSAAAANAVLGTPQPYVPQVEQGTLAKEKPESALRIARAAAASGDYGIAAKLYRQLAASSNASPDVLSELGDVLLAAEDIPEAERAYNGALNKSRSHLGATIGLGKVYLALNRPAEAQAYFECAFALAPENRRVLNGLAVARDSTGDHAGAQEIYRRALALYPNDPSLRRNYELSQSLAAQSTAPQASGAAPGGGAAPQAETPPLAAPTAPVVVAPIQP